jgi:hypothetical protein
MQQAALAKTFSICRSVFSWAAAVDLLIVFGDAKSKQLFMPWQ